MKTHTIPDDIREWVERTAPTLTKDGWVEVERIAEHGFDEMGARWFVNEARALLAYRYEVARGLTESCDYATSLARVVRGENPILPSAKWSRLRRAGLVSDTGAATPWGRVIAERARVLAD